MKVYIGPYTNWIGPYQIAEKLLFWMKKDEYGSNNDTVHKFGKWLSVDKHGNKSRLTKVCEWIDRKKKRNVKVRIDGYDCWGLYSTLALIILPALKKLKEQKHGSPFVENEDVPEELRSAPGVDPYSNDDDGWEKRWEWVMDEMIFAFEMTNTDWEDKFWKVKPELDMKHYPEDEGQLTVPVRWEVEGECDWEGRKAVEERMRNGFKLFGKYYQGLWD